MNFETKKVLITVKAYPNPSQKYGETVCCAGIDMDTYQFIRLYPIPFRDLDDDKKFGKYSIINVACTKPNDDKRPESYRVEIDTIKILERWDTKDGWRRRKSVVLKLPIKSMCRVYQEAKESDLSLALVKPSDISFEYKKKSPSQMESHPECYAQLTFFNKVKQVLEPIPFDFYYVFRCPDLTDCSSHKLPIIDWEIGQAYRNWRYKYKPEDNLLEKIKQRWMSMCTTDKDTYFYVGNIKRFRDTFMVLGAFYPPI